MSLSPTQFGYGRTARGAEAIPGEPGTSPVPEGHARLMHSAVHGDPEKMAPLLKKEGLRLDKALGSSYGEPDTIWAAAGTQPYNQSAATVEFSAPPGDLDIGRFESPERLESHRSHVTLNRNVSPDEFIAVHEPWHAHYRYVVEDERTSADLESGGFDTMLDMGDGVGRGLREAKKDAGVARVMRFGEDLS